MKKSKLYLALLTAMAVQAPYHAFAQDADNQADASVAEEQKKKEEAEQEVLNKAEMEVITVGGMRSSEVAAINMKKFADTISDNLSAEEVGVLPDQSIAESLERLTGVTGNQERGRSNTISVRGMGGAYTLTTLNNREIVSSFGSRSINLSLFPSAAIRKAQVYKTARADALEGGISGHVNMETFKPLEVEKNIRTFSATVNSNELYQDLSDGDKYGTKIDGMFSQHITDGLAVSIGASVRDDIRYLESVKNGPFVTGAAWFPDWNQDGVVDVQNGSTVLNSKKVDIDQDAVFAAVQYSPNDDFVISFDYLHSNYDFLQNGLTLSNGIVWGVDRLTDPAVADVNLDNNYVMSGLVRTTGSMGKWDSSVVNEDQTEVFGLNFDYNITDDVNLNVDFAHSSAERFYSWRSVNGKLGGGYNHYFAFDHNNDEYGFEYFGSDLDGSAYNAETGMVDTSLTMNAITLDSWNFEKLSNGHNYMDSAVSAAKFDVTWYVDLGMVHQLKFGARYSKNTKDHTDDGEQYDAGTLGQEEFDRIFGSLDWDSLAKTLTDNPFQKLDKVKGFDDVYYFDAGDVLALVGGELPERMLTDEDRFASYELEEDSYAVYAQASFAGDWFDGVFGVRYYSTELESTSWQSDFTIEQVSEDGDFALIIGDMPGYVTNTNDYSGFLPSLNVNLRLIEDTIIRIGAGKAMIRPSLGEINNSIDLRNSDAEFSVGENISSRKLGKAGNPYLDPIESTQFDISFEYYKRQNYYALAGFYKDLDGIYEQGATYIPIQGATDGGGNELELPITTEVKAEGGSISGWEFSFRQNLGDFTDVLRGFAVSGNYMDFFHDAVQDYNPRIPGQGPITRPSELYYAPQGWIDSTYNVALTYDYGKKFSARINLNQQEAQAGRDGQDYFVQWPSKNLSVNFRYRVIPEVTLFAQAANLLDEETTKGYLSSQFVNTAYDDYIAEQSHRGISWYAGVRLNF